MTSLNIISELSPHDPRIASFFTIARFVPFPSSGEYLNIAVISRDAQSGEISFQGLEQWERAEAFGPSYLVDRAKRVIAKLDEKIAQAIARAAEADEDPLAFLHRQYAGTVQFAQPRPSFEKPEQSLARLAPVLMPSVPTAE